MSRIEPVAFQVERKKIVLLARTTHFQYGTLAAIIIVVFAFASAYLSRPFILSSLKLAELESKIIGTKTFSDFCQHGDSLGLCPVLASLVCRKSGI